MFSKKAKIFSVFFGVLLATALACQPVSAKWVPDDEGNLHWWEPPKEPIYKIEKRPVVLGQCDAQVLFMMDTSGSMNDEFDVLCNKIGDIVQGLRDGGITIDYKILGIHRTRNCATETVSGSVPNPTVNHTEDWGPAVEDVAEQYNWKSGYVRIAIPMSDEGAENGDSWTSADDDAIDRAKEAARKNSVGVIPVIGTPWSQSQYPMIVAGAQELANYCWGQAFLSTDPTQDLVDGIVQAINDLCTPHSDKVGVGIYVDDAFADAGTKEYVNKIPGDIAFLVAQITNGADQAFTGDLKISFPNTWNLVDHDNVMRRKKAEPWVEEVCTESVDKSTQGEVVIKGISIPKDDNATSNENEGKTREYVVKVIIPKSQIANVCMNVNAEVTPSVGGSSFLTANDSFMVSINSIGDMILTNRHLLFERHSDKEKVLEILKEIQKIALEQSAIVFYVDWWDEYDNFSGNNPNGTGSDEASTPIKNWDRSTDIDYTSETTANQKVCTPVDNYTHYWAGQLGGLNQDRYLLIVGGDEIIPFFRLGGIPHDPWFFYDDPTSGFPVVRPSDYDASTYTEEAASHDFAYSDVVYADTDDSNYQDADVENIFPGRIVGEDLDNLLKALRKVDQTRSERDNVVISALSGDAARFPQAARKAASDSKDLDYTVNPENGLDLYEKAFSFDDLKDEFAQPFDHFIYRGHGSTTEASGRFEGSDFDGLVTLSNGSTHLSNFFSVYKPHFMMIDCLNGQVDKDNEASANGDLMIYSLMRNHVRDAIGATTVSNGSQNNVFLEYYYGNVIGRPWQANIPFWPWSPDPKTLGKAMKIARDNVRASDPDERACAPIYVLYGTPWHKYTSPKSRTSASALVLAAMNVKSAPAEKIQVSTIKGTTVKTIQETIDTYSIETDADFDFIKIDGYRRLERGEDTPVLPVKRFYITVPKAANLNNVSVSTGSEVALGTLNIPVTSDAPPMPNSNYAYYLAAPHSIGLYDAFYSSFSYTTQNNIVLVIDLFPVSYDTVSDQAKLYKDVEIIVSYETEQKGVLLGASPEKQSYSSSETINVGVSIENIIDQATQFDITVELKDRLQNTVQTQTSSITIDPAHIGQTTVQLQAPSKGGSYWVETSVSDGTQEIGTASEHINVNPGDITDILVPRCIPGGTSEFTVTFHNSSGGDIDVAFGLSIYEGATLRADFIPVIYSVPADTDETASFKWEIPPDFPGGNYLSVATATSEGFTTSLSEGFGIGGLDMGWNLISLPLQPSDTSIGAVLNPISGKYSSAWAYQNNGWKVYDPANPGFNDLATMEIGWGYWLNMTEAANLTVSGNEPSKSIDLIASWNLVGYNSSTAQSTADALASISGKVVSAWAYIDGSWKVYDPANPGFSDLTTMEPGYGYWIKTTEACTWTLP